MLFIRVFLLLFFGVSFFVTVENLCTSELNSRMTKITLTDYSFVFDVLQAQNKYYL